MGVVTRLIAVVSPAPLPCEVVTPKLTGATLTVFTLMVIGRAVEQLLEWSRFLGGGVGDADGSRQCRGRRSAGTGTPCKSVGVPEHVAVIHGDGVVVAIPLMHDRGAGDHIIPQLDDGLAAPPG